MVQDAPTATGTALPNGATVYYHGIVDVHYSKNQSRSGCGQVR